MPDSVVWFALFYIISVVDRELFFPLPLKADGDDHFTEKMNRLGCQLLVTREITVP